MDTITLHTVNLSRYVQTMFNVENASRFILTNETLYELCPSYYLLFSRLNARYRQL